MLGEKIPCATVSPHLYRHTYKCRLFGVCPPLRQLSSDQGDFKTGVRQSVKITTADSNPDVGRGGDAFDLISLTPRAHFHVVGMLRFMSLTYTNRACPLLFVLFLCLFLS